MAKPAKSATPEILTIGHSTRPLDAFIAMLKAHGVACLVDVRTIPRSRHNPQFNGETLGAALREAGIAYRPMKSLGGLRHPRKDSPNAGWRNEGFRGFADYMQSDEFAAAIGELRATGARRRTAIMCAEAVPWRCHRSLIADALTVRGVPVEHIMSEEKRDPHRLTSFAVVDGERITYPPEQLTLDTAAPGDATRSPAKSRRKP
jgi:uncharacterized protein (DUF488 family)